MPPDCPRMLPYEPIIVVPTSILRSIDPSWASCGGDIRGIYDPPYPLSSNTIADLPVVTTHIAPSPVSALPAPFTLAPTPKSTSDPNDPGNVVSSILDANDPTASDPRTPMATSPSQNSQSRAASSTKDPNGSSTSTIIGGEHSSTREGAATQQADPTVSSPEAAVGASVASLLNGVGSSEAQPVSEQTLALNSAAAAPPAQTISADPLNSVGVVVGGQTLRPGAQTTISSTPVSVGSQGSVAIGASSTVNVDTVPQQIGGHSVSAVPSGSGRIVAGDQNLQPGARTTIDNTAASMGQGGTEAVGGVTTVNAASASQVIGKQSIAADPSNSEGIIVAGQAPQPGAPTTIDQTPVSIDRGGTLAVGSIIGQVSPVPAPLAAVVTIGSNTYAVSSGNPLVIGSSTISVGGPVATVSGQAVSLDPQGIVVGSSIVAYPAAPSRGENAAVTIGGNIYTASSGRPLVIGSSTLSAGGLVETIDGQRVSVGVDGVIIDSSTIAYSSAAVPVGGDGTVITIGGHTYRVSSGVPLVIGSTTLSEGGPSVTIDGQRVSIRPQGVVIGSTTEAYAASGPHSELPQAAVTLGSQDYTALESSGKVVLGSITLTNGGPAQTISGQIFSAAPSGIVVDGTTQSFSMQPPVIDGITATSEASVTIAGQLYTALGVSGHKGEIIIPGITRRRSLTLKVGGPAVTISGQIVSAASNGLVVGSITIPYVSEASTSSHIEVEAHLTIGGSTYTAFEVSGRRGEIVIPGASITLFAGGSAATINGEAISAASSGLVVDGSIDAFETATTDTSPTISDAMIGLWDGSGTTESATGSSPTPPPSGSSIAHSRAARSILEWQWVVFAVVVNALAAHIFS